MTIFIRLVEVYVDFKADVLKRTLAAIAAGEEVSRSEVFRRDPASFGRIPGSPFAYWTSANIAELFSAAPQIEARRGLGTDDDFRFLRLWLETGTSERWRPMAKGGTYARFYSDLPLVLNWSGSGKELRALIVQRWGNEGKRIYNESYFGRPGITWSPRTQSGLGMRVLPAGVILGSKGPAFFVNGNSPVLLLASLALVASSMYGFLVSMQMAFGSYEVGVIQRTPLPVMPPETQTELARIARRIWSLTRSLDTWNETSHVFLLPARVRREIGVIPEPVVARELGELQEQIDELAFSLYGITANDRHSIGTSSDLVGTFSHQDESSDDDGGADQSDDVDVASGSEAVGSWLVGVAFGRFDPRLATGERAIPPEPEPFDPLPSRSPGMYPEGEEPKDRPAILVDDEGHPDDLAARAQAVAERVGVAVAENLRTWLAKEFFPLHIKMYSKSRRKAPIYWQLATPSASYSVWLYIHAFTKDTLFRVQNEYVAPKLAHEERRLESLTSELRDGATAAQRKALAAQEAFVEELRAFLAEVKRVAPLWNPDLDDGVIINFAPLWRLVPQNKAWQKELKATWDALCEGKYDWAHLSMHLWPERVVPKCAKDRSLAIAHGIEEVFWIEGSDGKWSARKSPTRGIDEIVRERTSPAVKAALTRLLEAPVQTGAPKKRRKGKAVA